MITATSGSLIATALVTVMVTNENEPPVFAGVPYAFTLAENQDGGTMPVAVGAVAATDPEGDLVSYRINAGNTGARFAFLDATDGRITYAGPGEDFETAGAPPQYELAVAALAGGQEAATTVGITVTDVNDPAVITGQGAEGGDGEVTEDADENTVQGKLTVMDPDDEDLFVATPPGGIAGEYGTFVITTAGDWTYTLDNDDPETDALAEGQREVESFTVRAADGTEVMVVITIIGANDPAVFGGQLAGEVSEDAAENQTTGTVMVSDVDGEDRVARAGALGTVEVVGTYGIFVITDAGAWTYTLDNNDPETDALTAKQREVETFTVEAEDGTQERVEVTVVGADDVLPTADAGEDRAVAEGVRVTLDGGASLPDDPANGPLRYAWEQSGGRAVVLSDAAIAAPVFTAPGDLVADAVLVFALVVTDTRDVASEEDTVTITVQAAPTANAGEDRGVSEGASVTLDGGLSRSRDADDETLRYAWRAPPGISLANPATAQPIFTAPAGLLEDAILEFGLVVTDARELVSEEDTVTITVVFVNDAPLAVADAIEVNEGGTATTLTGGALSVRDNDSDVETPIGELTVSVDTPPAHGTLDLNTDGTFSYTHDDSETLSDSFTYQVSDGELSSNAVVTITITAVDDPTTIAGDLEGDVTEATATVAGTSTDTGALVITDPDSGDTTVAVVDPPGGGGAYGTFEITPAGVWTYTLNNEDQDTNALDETQQETETFTVQAADGVQATVAIVVNGANDAPTADAGDDAQTNVGTRVTLRGSGLDPENDRLRYRWTNTGLSLGGLLGEDTATLIIIAPNSLTVSPFAQEIQLVVTDAHGAASEPDLVTVTFIAANRQPTAVPTGPGRVEEGQLAMLDGTESFDPDGDELTYTWIQNRFFFFPVTREDGVQVQIEQDLPTIEFLDKNTATPTFVAPTELPGDGHQLFLLVVTDEHGLSSGAVGVTVRFIAGDNEAPVAEAGPDQTVAEGAIVSLDGSASMDPENSPLTFAWSAPPGVTLDDATAIRPTFTAPVNLPVDAELEISLIVSDFLIKPSAPDTVTITVTSSNEPPVAVADAFTVAEGGTATTLTGGALSVRDNDSDAETPTAELTVRVAAGPDHGTLDLNEDGTFTYTHNGDEEAGDRFTYIVNDGALDSDPATVTITVTPVNDAPLADAGLPQTVDEGVTVTLDGLGSSDPEGGRLTYQWSHAGGPEVTLNDANTARPTFTAPTGFKADSLPVFRLVVTDDKGASSLPDTVTITVRGVDDPPVFDLPDGTLVYQFFLDENQVGSPPFELGTITATDPDISDTVVYTISRNAGNLFSVDPASGVFSYTGPGENYEAIFGRQPGSPSYQPVATATAGGRTVEVLVIVAIRNVNEPPRFINQPYQYMLAEHTSGHPPVVLGTVAARDPDSAADPLGEVTLTYSIVTPTTRYAIDADGEITFTGPSEDRETQPVRTLMVRVTDNGGLTDTATVTINITNVDETPEFEQLFYSFDLAENRVGTPPILLGKVTAIDPDGDEIIYAIAIGDTDRFSVDPGSGAFSYTGPGEDHEAPGGPPVYTIIVSATAGERFTQVAVVVTIINVNEPPEAEADAITVAEGGTATTLSGSASSVLNNDRDVDTAVGSLRVTLMAAPVNGRFTLNPDGTFSYAHNGDETRSDSFTYIVNDGFLDSVAATVTITITPVNDLPVAVNDAFTVVEGGTATTLTGGALSVRDNDSDVETATDALTVRVETGPAHGALTLNADGTFIYAHNGDEEDSDRFTYIVNDGDDDSVPATVAITVMLENDAPVARDDAITVIEGGTTATLTDEVTTSVTANDSDAETSADDLTVRVATGPDNGELTLNPNGAFSYTHDGGETLSDSFTYIANDGALDSNTATVAITITADNDAPLAVDDAITVAEGGTATALADGALSVLDNDTDADTDAGALTVRVATGPANGTLTLNTDGTFSYTHDGGETSSDRFTYIVNDTERDSAPATVTITITGENDPPVAVDDAVETNEDMAVVFDAHSNDTDVDGDTLFVAAINGTDVIAGDGQAIAVTDGGTLTLNADGRLNFNPNGAFEDLAPDESSEVTATYQITDGRGGTDEGTVTITVTPVNDAPLAVADEITVAEGGTATTLTGGALSVRANDSDVDTAQSALIVSRVTAPAHGTLTLNTDGTFSYVHNGDEEDSDRFTYRVNDGALDSNTATVTITITPVNDPPVALGDAFTVAEGGTATTLADGMTTSVTANDSDAETSADDLTVRVATGPDNGELTLNPNGAFSYTHDGGETTSDSFTYIANDGDDDSAPATVTITITQENDAPVARADAFTVAEGGTATTLAGGALSVRDNDSDAETATNALTVRVATGPANGTLTLNTDGTFSYVHNGGETSSDSFTYIVSDTERDSAPATVTITVTPVNDAPVAVDDEITVAEGGMATTLADDITTNVLANDTDSDTDAGELTVKVDSGPANGALTLNADGTFMYVHDGTETLSDSFTYIVNDGALDSAPATVTITVTPENDPPVAVADAFTVAEGGTATTLTGGALSVLANDTDSDTDAGELTVKVDSGPASGALTLNADGTFMYVHDGTETLSDSFTYIVNDGALDSNAATVTITVMPVNDAPMAVADAFTVAEGGTAMTLTSGATSVRDNDRDAETATDELTVRVGTGPAHGTLDLNEDGTFTYTHNGDEEDSDSFTYIVNDTERDSSPATVTITVTPEDDPPVFDLSTYAFGLAENQNGSSTPVAVGVVTATDPDVSDTPVYAIAAGDLQNKFEIDSASGAIGYIGTGEDFEAPDGPPVYVLMVTATAGGVPVTTTVTITVTNVDEPPMFDPDTYAFDLEENRNGSTSVVAFAAVTATDPDDGDTPTYTITAGGAGLFNIDETSGVIRYTGTGENFEALPLSYALTITATANGQNDTASVTVTVTNVNEPPEFVGDPYAFTLAENRDGSATEVAFDAVTATDPENVPIVYSITAGDTPLFDINGASGVIRYIGTGEDFEAQSGVPVYNLTITATAGGGPPTATAAVTVTVTDANDPPVAMDDDADTTEDEVVAIDVLDNDRDVDAANDILTVVAINNTPVTAGAGQAVAVMNGGTLTLIAGGNLNFNPNGAFENLAMGGSRSVTATYQISDGRGGTAEAQVTITVRGLNDAPTADAGMMQTVTEGMIVTLDGTRSSDPEGGPLTYQWTRTDGPLVTLSNVAQPTFTSPTGLSEDAMLEFQLIVTDDQNTASEPDTVIITVTGDDDIPVFTDTPYAFTLAENEDGSSTPVDVGVVTATDADETDTPSYAIAEGDPQGKFEIDSASGAIGYIGAGENFEAQGGPPVYNLMVTATAGGVSVPTAVTVTVTDANDPPVAVDDDADANEDTAMAIDVLANDTDEDAANDPLSVVAINGTAVTAGDGQAIDVTGGGTLTLTADGRLNFNPNGEFEDLASTEDRSVTATYQITDGSATAGGTLTITVTGLNDPAVISGLLGEVTEDADENTAAGMLMVDDVDGADGFAPAASIVLTPDGDYQGIYGTLAIVPAGDWTYTLDNADPQTDALAADAEVMDTFEVMALDGTPATVVITVIGANDPPQAVADEIMVAEGGTATTLTGGALSVRANDRDVDTAQSALTVSRVTAPAHGTLDLNEDGTFSYEHNGSETNSDSFTYIVNDGVLNSVPATVTITVTPENDAPVAVDDTFVTNEDTAMVFDALANDTDADNDALTVAAINGTTVTAGGGQVIDVTDGGTLTLNADGMLSFDPRGAFDDLAPTANREVTATYQITDGRGGTDEGEVTITVNGLNDAPTADAGLPQTVAEGVTVTLDGTGSSDPENGMLDYEWTHTSDPVVTLSNATIAQPTFTAPTGLSEAVSFVFQLIVTDDQSEPSLPDTVTIMVTGEDDIPVFTGVPYAFDLAENQDGSSTPIVLGTVTATDPDESDTPVYAIIDGNTQDKFEIDSASGAIGYTGTGEDFEETGGPPVYELSVTATAGNVPVTTTVTITVTNVDEAPEFVGDPYAFTLLENEDGSTMPIDVDTVRATDPENDPITYSITGGAGLFTIIPATGVIRYIGTGEDFETVPLTYALTVTATAGALDATAAVTVTVTNANDPPVAVADAISTNEDTAITIDVLANDTDQENDTLSVIAINGVTVMNVGDMVDVTGGGTLTLIVGGDLNFNPVGAFDDLLPGQNRPVTATYRIMDDQNAIADGDITITVTGVNDPPVFINTPYVFTLIENQPGDGGTPVAVGAVAADDPDAGDTLTYAITTTGATRFSIDEASGAITYTGSGEDLETQASHTLMVRVTDGAGDTDTAMVTINIGNEDEPPVFAPATYAFNLEENRNGTPPVMLGTATATDPENDAIVYSITTGDAGLFSINGASGAISYIGVGEDFEAQSGPPVYNLTITATAGGAAATAPVTVTVTDANDPPVAVDDDADTTEDAMVAIDVLDNDMDVDAANDPLTVTAINGTTVNDGQAVAVSGGGTLSRNAGGNLNFNPVGAFDDLAPTENREVMATYQISDGRGGTAEAQVTITVRGINDAPTADAGEPQTVDEGVTVTLDGTASTDPENGVLTYQWSRTSGPLVTLSDATAQPTFTAPTGLTEAVSFGFQLVVTDDQNTASEPDTVTITVTGMNDPPVFDSLTYAFDLPENEDGSSTPVDVGTVIATDADATDTPVYAIAAGDPQGKFEINSASGAIAYTGTGEDFEAPDGPPVYELSVTATAGGDTATAAVTVTVTNVDEPPVFDPDTYEFDLAENRDGGASVVAFDAVTATDPEGDEIVYSITTGGAGLFNIDGTSGVIRYTGAGEDFEAQGGAPSYNLTITATAGTFAATAPVTVSVTNVDEPPVFDPASYEFELVENRDGGTTAIEFSAVTATDPENVPIVYSITAGGMSLFDIDGASGVIRYTGSGEDFEETGGPPIYNLTITATAGGAPATATAPVTVTVTDANDPPLAMDDDADTTEDEVVAIDVLDNDMDVDAANDTLTVVAINGTAVTAGGGQTVAVMNGGTLTLTADGELSFDPRGAFDDLAPTEDRSVTATYQITDGSATDEGEVTITVTGVNDAPTANAGPPQTVAEGVTVTLDGTASTDPENGVLTYQWSRASGPLVTLSAATIAQPTFTAPTGLTEAVSFGFRLVVTDDQNTASEPDAVTITVSAAAVIGGNLSGAVVEDAAQNQATGTLAIINPDGAAETFVAQDDPTPGTFGTFTLAATGAWTYTLDNSRDATNRLSAGRDGMEAFSVAASAPGIPGAMVRIMITGVNDVPVAMADTLATDEDTPAPIAVLDNDTDPEDDALSVATINGAPANIGVSVALPGGGTLTRNADGRLDFDPLGAFDDLQVGEDREVIVAYQITDGANTADGTLTITVSGVNDAPVAVADTGGTDEDTAVVIDVLANDTDAESDSLTVSAINGMAVNDDQAVAVSGGGTLTRNADGMLSFDPNGEFDELAPATSSELTATYRVSDGRATADGTLTITVTGADDEPEFDVPNYEFDLAENEDGSTTPVDLGMVTATDPDVSDTPVYVITAGDTTRFLVDGTSGVISYIGTGENFETPPPTYDLTIIATANGQSDTASVTVTVTNVDEPPEFVGDPYAFTLLENEDGSTMPINVDTVMATDPENDPVTYSITAGGAGLFDIIPATGVIRYVGDGEDFETPPLTYDLTVTATAGGLSATAAVTVTVSNANDPPMAVADAISTNEDTAITIAVLDNDTDPENDTLSVIAINGVTVMNVGDMVVLSGGGTLTLIVGDDLNFNPVGAFDDLLPGASRMVTATYRIMDDQNAIANGDITITVTGENDPPVFINTPYVFTLIENQPGDGGTPVPVGMVAAEDPDTGDTLTYAITTTTTLFNIDPGSGAITYTGPGEDLETQPSYTLMVRVTDGADATDTATVTINITNEDEPPVFDPDTYAFNLAENEDGSSTPVDLGVVTATDPDVSDTPVYVITAGDTTRFLVDGTSGVISYIGTGENFETPPPTYALTIIATANTLTDTASVTVTVTNVNEPPEFVGDPYAFTLLENEDGSTMPIDVDTVTATDPENDAITYSITTGGAGLFNIDEDSGAISYTGTGEDFEAPGGPPTYDLTITATAGGQDATAPVTVRVTAANDAPVAESDALMVLEGGTARALTDGATSVLANDRDVDTAQGSLTARVATTPANGALTLNADGTFTYTHDGSETSGDSFTYIVNDGALDSNTATVTITVTADNDAPTAEAGQPQTVAEGATVTLDGSASSDPESDALTFAWTQLSGEQVTLDDTAAERPTFIAPTELLSAAVLEFRLIVADPQNAASAPDTVTITVTAGANDAPTARAGPDQTVDEPDGAVVTVTLDGSASTDPEGETLLYEWSQASGPVVSLAGMNTVRPVFAVPQLTDNMALVFSLTVEDAQSTSNPDTVTITVMANDDSPVAMDDRIVMTRGATATTLAGGATSVLDNDRDPDTARSGLTASMMTLPQYGTLSLLGDGTFTYVHDGSEERRDSFTYRVSDGNTNSNIATVRVEMQTGRERHARVMKGWLARFGRTVASDAGESISERMTGSPGQARASWVVIGGHRMSLDAPRIIDGGGAQPHGGVGYANAHVNANGPGPGFAQIPFTRDPDEWSRQEGADSEVMSSRELLTRSAFQINLHEDGANGNAAGGNVVLWGRGTGSSFDGKDIDDDNENDVLTLSGDVTSVTFGVESIDENTRGGIALTHSEGDGEWDFGEANDSEGDLEASLTSVYPYAHWASPNGWEVWGLLGYGQGEMRLKEAGEATQETDIKMGMMSLGARYDLFAGRAFGLAVKGDALALQIESEETAQLAEIKEDVQRGRLFLEGTHAPILESGNRVRTTLELGVRQDAGDAEIGTGGDVGVSFNYANPNAGVDFTIQGRYLVDHEDKNFEDWSGGVAARFDPGAPGRGLALTLEPEWNDAGHSQRLTLDFAGIWKGRGWHTPPGLRLELYGTRREREDAPAEHGIGLTFSFRF